jgi:hypothetical protein
MPLDFIKSEKGQDLLVDHGFIYRHRKTNENSGKIIWRCIEGDTDKKCHGGCHTVGDHITQRKDHNHAPDPAKVEARRAMNQVKDRALSSQEPTTNVIAYASSSLSQAACGQLPSTSRLARNIQRYRQKEGQAPPNPRNLFDLVIDENSPYVQTKSGDVFLQFDSGPSNDRVLIFTTYKNLRAMSSCDHWYADGTFKVVPPLFNQLYTIHGFAQNNVLPSIYILMPNRREETYDRVFTAIKNLQPNLNPVSVMTDFELAAINAFKSSFPNSNARGCFFHFSQCLWRKIQSPLCHDINDMYSQTSR